MNATELLAAMKATKNSYGDSKFPNAKIWEGHGITRIYTGHGREFVTITENGVEKSQTNLSWGRDIDEVVEGLTAAQ